MDYDASCFLWVNILRWVGEQILVCRVSHFCEAMLQQQIAWLPLDLVMLCFKVLITPDRFQNDEGEIGYTVSQLQQQRHVVCTVWLPAVLFLLKFTVDTDATQEVSMPYDVKTFTSFHVPERAFNHLQKSLSSCVEYDYQSWQMAHVSPYPPARWVFITVCLPTITPCLSPCWISSCLLLSVNVCRYPPQPLAWSQWPPHGHATLPFAILNNPCCAAMLRCFVCVRLVLWVAGLKAHWLAQYRDSNAACSQLSYIGSCTSMFVVRRTANAYEF